MTEKATFGAGCFWGVETAFSQLPGVIETAVGYMGGDDSQTTYEAVCYGDTGHADVLELEFDSAVITYRELLLKFFSCHDPTQLNRQGSDVGTQYRSVVFFNDQSQAAAARDVLEKLDAAQYFSRPVVTEISPAPTFHRAEEYHQQYHVKNGGHCAVHFSPLPDSI